MTPAQGEGGFFKAISLSKKSLPKLLFATNWQVVGVGNFAVDLLSSAVLQVGHWLRKTSLKHPISKNAFKKT